MTPYHQTHYQPISILHHPITDNIAALLSRSDKLMMSDVLNVTIKENKKRRTNAQIINHTLNINNIIAAYGKGYKLLHNNTATVHLNNANEANKAIMNGMIIKNMQVGSSICDGDIRYCKNIEKLQLGINCRIASCAPFAKSLRTLITIGTSQISNYGICMCTLLENLNANNNEKITTCEPFAQSLRTLSAYKLCGITDAGLYLCKNIHTLYANFNEKITTCEPFAQSLRTLSCLRHTDHAASPTGDCIIVQTLKN